MTDDTPAEPHAALNHAGAVVDQAIDYMVGKEIASLAIASALLGGALGLMARTMKPEQIVAVLRRAIASAEGGDLAAMDRR